MKLLKIKLFFAISSFFCMYAGTVYCQELNQFRVLVKNKCSAIKDQGNSGTCWSFASISFIESEIERVSNLDIDLSEWFIVRNIYPEKIRNYIRTEGNTFLSSGGQTQDVLWVIKHKGLMPEQMFPGPKKSGKFNSVRIDTSIIDFSESLRWNDKGLISSNWETQLDSILDSNLGKNPANFKYEQQIYTPITFRDYLGIDINDYIQITSFNHHDYYQPFSLESKFNWSYSAYMNLPLEDFMVALDTALLNGYTVALNIDVTENDFEFAFKSDTGIIKSDYQFVDQNIRQNLFENGQTRVDHMMHIVGIEEDNNKKRYYITKNSWGKIGALNGFLYISQEYIMSKAMSLTMHVNALSSNILDKINK